MTEPCELLVGAAGSCVEPLIEDVGLLVLLVLLVFVGAVVWAPETGDLVVLLSAGAGADVDAAEGLLVVPVVLVVEPPVVVLVWSAWPVVWLVEVAVLPAAADDDDAGSEETLPVEVSAKTLIGHQHSAVTTPVAIKPFVLALLLVIILAITAPLPLIFITQDAWAGAAIATPAVKAATLNLVAV